MKLTKRELFLVQFLGIVAIISLTYYFIIMPQIDKLKNVSEQLVTKDLEVAMVKGEIASLSEYDTRIAEVNDIIKANAEEFFPEILQKKLIVILDQLLKDTEISAEAIGFSQVTQRSAENAMATTTLTGSGETALLVDLPVVESMSITMPLNGSYEQVIDLIKRVEDMERVIVINSLQLSQAEDAGISGGINFDFYSLSKPGLNTRDEDYLSWEYSDSYGVDNPFNTAITQQESGDTTEADAEAD